MKFLLGKLIFFVLKIGGFNEPCTIVSGNNLALKSAELRISYSLLLVTKNLSEKRSVKSSEMSPVPVRSAGQAAKAYLHQPHRVSQVLQVPAVNLHPIRKKGQAKDPATLSEYSQLILYSFN